MKRSTRKTANLPKSLNRQLNSYALAASATGVAVLALANSAEAKIVYTRANGVIGRNSAYWFSIVKGQTNLIFTAYSSHSTGFSGGWLFVNPRSGNFLGHSSFRGDWLAAALPAGYSISGHDKSNSFNGIDVQGFMAGFACTTTGKEHCSSGGSWLGLKQRYLGLEFRIKGKVHFGWARLKTRCAKSYGCTAVLTGYAYETIPYKAIRAGRTKGPDVITLTEPASLGHLAHGASAIPAWRTNP